MVNCEWIKSSKTKCNKVKYRKYIHLFNRRLANFTNIRMSGDERWLFGGLNINLREKQTIERWRQLFNAWRRAFLSTRWLTKITGVLCMSTYTHTRAREHAGSRTQVANRFFSFALPRYLTTACPIQLATVQLMISRYRIARRVKRSPTPVAPIIDRWRFWNEATLECTIYSCGNLLYIYGHEVCRNVISENVECFICILAVSARFTIRKKHVIQTVKYNSTIMHYYRINKNDKWLVSRLRWQCVTVSERLCFNCALYVIVCVCVCGFYYVLWIITSRERNCLSLIAN